MLHFGAFRPDAAAWLAVPDTAPVIGQQVPQARPLQPALAGQHRAVRGQSHVGQARPAAGDQVQAHVPEGLLRQPAGAGEVQLHAQAVGRFRRPAEDVRQLLLAQPGGPALLPGGGAGAMPSISELVIVRVLLPETLNVSTIFRPPLSSS